MKQRYVYWQDQEMWLGYLEEFPDYWTQGETQAELQENLVDIYQELNSNAIPNVRRVLLSLKLRENVEISLNKLRQSVCVFIRHGKKHDWYQNSSNKSFATYTSPP